MVPGLASKKSEDFSKFTKLFSHSLRLSDTFPRNALRFLEAKPRPAWTALKRELRSYSLKRVKTL